MADTTKRLGFIGLGMLGGAMALRLLHRGQRLTVWNRNPDKSKPASAEGAAVAASPAEVAKNSDLIGLCLTDDAAVEAVVFGPDGVAQGGAAGKVLVDFSTIGPETARRLAERLRAECGMGWIDAPVSGGVPGALAGTLAVMAGGAPDDLTAARPLLDPLARQVTLMGPNGAGLATKLINQMIVACGFAVVAEATNLALAAGIDVAQVPLALAGGRADSPILQEYMPKMASGQYPQESRIDIMVKDLDLVDVLAQGCDTATPMTTLAGQLHRVLVSRGLGGADMASFIKLYRGAD